MNETDAADIYQGH